MDGDTGPTAESLVRKDLDPFVSDAVEAPQRSGRSPAQASLGACPQFGRLHPLHLRHGNGNIPEYGRQHLLDSPCTDEAVQLGITQAELSCLIAMKDAELRRNEPAEASNRRELNHSITLAVNDRCVCDLFH